MDPSSDNSNNLYGSNVQAPASSRPTSSSKQYVASIATSLLIILLVAGGFLLALQKANDKTVALQTQNSNLQNQLQLARADLVVSHDTLRKRDVAQLAAAIQNYNKTNNGHLTTEGSISRQIYQQQLSHVVPNFKDPKTKDLYTYEAVAPVQTPSPLKIGLIQYQWPAKCAANNDFVRTTDQSTSALRTLLEDGSAYCFAF